MAMTIDEQLRDQVVDVMNGFLDTIIGLREEIAVRDNLIDLVGPDIEWQEKHLTMRSSDRLQKIIGVYRQLRPGGARDEN